MPIQSGYDLAQSKTHLSAVAKGDGEGGLTYIQMLDNSVRDVELAEVDGHPGLDLVGYGDNVLTVFPNLTYLDPSGADGPEITLASSLDVYPSVMGGGRCTIRLSVGRPTAQILGAPAIEVYDAAGRRVTTLPLGPPGNRLYLHPWTGVDDQGRQLPSGIYWLRARGIRGVEPARVVFLR
jgi:hypothetical protein